MLGEDGRLAELGRGAMGIVSLVLEALDNRTLDKSTVGQALRLGGLTDMAVNLGI